MQKTIEAGLKRMASCSAMLLDMNTIAICIVRSHQAVQWRLRVPILVRSQFRVPVTGEASGW